MTPQLMNDLLDEIVANATSESGSCEGCPATCSLREDGTPRSKGVNPGLGHYDAEVMFVTIEPSPSHGRKIEWDTYDWTEYNKRFYDRLLDKWDSGEAVREIIAPVEGVTTDDVWVADSIKCPPPSGDDDENRSKEFDHCRDYLLQEIKEVNPEVLVAFGNRSAIRTLDVLDGPSVRMGTATQAGRRFDTNPPLIVSPSWSYGWLFDRSIYPTWGDDWVASQSELRDTTWNSYLEIIQSSLVAVMNN